MSDYKFETLQLHAGQEADNVIDNGARAVPIYQSSAFNFESTDIAAKLFKLEVPGYIYSRINNPTHTVFEQRVTALEGGYAGIATASGMAAQFLAISSLANTGDEIVASAYLYGGTGVQLRHSFKRLGVTTHFVTDSKPESFAEKINDKTKLIFIESIANPKMNVLDIQAIADIAHAHKIPLVIDNTFGGGGYVCRPIDYGADIVTHSATKWIGGHGSSIGGILIDSGNFDWNNEKFPNLCTPSPTFHDAVLTEVFEQDAFLVFARVEVLRNFGPSLSPFNSFLFLQGLETLSLRMERHSSNALQLAQYLENHPHVSWVWYPGLESSESYTNAKKYLRSGLFGGMLAFGHKDGIEASKKVIDSLKLVSHVANVGDAKTLAVHPATSTHEPLSEEQLIEAGVLPEMIRVSVGIEHIDDIIADFDQALK